ncbi:MAG: hypothetical protein M3336_15280 [Chloroflexota bacterium]|nr:hypothetical protein [Chloroflexota bacterium]
MTLVDPNANTLTSAERARLAAYRAAVAAGFYTDWDGTATTTDTEALAGLGRPVVQVSEYPFTSAELARLTACRAAIAAGYYSEDLPPPKA